MDPDRTFDKHRIRPQIELKTTNIGRGIDTILITNVSFIFKTKINELSKILLFKLNYISNATLQCVI